MLNDQQPRRVVPRWRASRVTASTMEAKSRKLKVQSPEASRDDDQEVQLKIRELEIVQSVPVAAELMFLASAAGNHAAARQAAQAIVANRDKIGARQLIRTADQILNGGSAERTDTASNDFIRHARASLVVNYDNPVLLIDVARELTALRQEKNALKYIRSAVALAPRSRFVLRSAARYYLHIGEHEVAHDLLRRSPLINSDPWIQASEIAVATVRGRTSTLVRQANKALSETSQINSEATELASAVATVELLSGSNKRAKALFKQALSYPNDNSLAQAEWAATKLKLVVDQKVLKTPMSFEANSHNAYRRHEIDEAIKHAKLWAADEPFASRPWDAMCYFLNLDERYSDALDAAKAAHALERDGIGPALNIIFSKTQMGDLDGAIEDFIRLGRHPDLKQYAAHYLANAGAISYALGNYEEARHLYQRAVKAAREQGEPSTEALARAFFARIATRANDPQASVIVQEAAELVPRLPSTGAIYVVQSLVDSSAQKNLQGKALARIAKPEWHWDTISNTLRLLDS